MQMSSFKPCRFHAICATVITLAFVVSGQMVLAVDGDLDPTFGTVSITAPTSLTPWQSRPMAS